IVGVKMSPFERLIQKPKGSSYIESLRLMDQMWRRKESKDAMLMVVMQQIELLANCRNSNYIAETGSQESEESSLSRIERMLEVMLQQVVSIYLGIEELRCDLLDLCQKVKDHEVSIRQLEDRMNLLASEMTTKSDEGRRRPVTPKQCG
ncbi:hypothetical protein HAX54_029027, partial [Datura stramonium]|nr:hypothetical protein [Datura stramonium]